MVDMTHNDDKVRSMMVLVRTLNQRKDYAVAILVFLGKSLWQRGRSRRLLFA
jgi:hypothetical protein